MLVLVALLRAIWREDDRTGEPDGPHHRHLGVRGRITATRTVPSAAGPYTATAAASGTYTVDVAAVAGTPASPITVTYLVTAADAAGNVSAATVVTYAVTRWGRPPGIPASYRPPTVPIPGSPMVRVIPTTELQRGTRGDSRRRIASGKASGGSPEGVDGRPDEPAVVVPGVGAAAGKYAPRGA